MASYISMSACHLLVCTRTKHCLQLTSLLVPSSAKWGLDSCPSTPSVILLVWVLKHISGMSGLDHWRPPGWFTSVTHWLPVLDSDLRGESVKHYSTPTLGRGQPPYRTAHCSGHLMRVEEQTDGTVRWLLAHALIVFPLCLRVEWTTLPKPRQRLRPLLLLLLLRLHVHIHVCQHRRRI